MYSQVFTAGELATVVDHTALAGLAELAQLQGDRPKAKALWDEAEKRLRAHPDLEGFGHRRELAQILLARGDRADLPEALDLMRREAQVRRDAQTLDTLAWALLETAIHSGTIDSGVTDSGVADSGVTDSQVTGTQNLQAAAAIAQEALQQNPNNAQLLYRAGLISQQLGQAPTAPEFKQQSQKPGQTHVTPLSPEGTELLWWGTQAETSRVGALPDKAQSERRY
ncbi:MAG: hypothetical protein HC857_11510 [Synechococcales cyanobacterium RU_4_20]|nr:hypothetical protein [Synechococcales cyanobacterium RU_4_20]